MPLHSTTECEMKMNHKSIYLSIILLILLNATGLNAQNVEVTITGIKSQKGQMVVGVFTDDLSFRKEHGILKTMVPKTNLSDGTMTFSLSLEPGLYGLSVLDDENCDGKMDYGMLGMPKEGFGFSDYYHTGLKKPKFDSFKFTVDNGQVKKITVKMRYF